MLENTDRCSEHAYIQAPGFLSFEDTARGRVCLMLNPDVKDRASNSSLHFRMLNLFLCNLAMADAQQVRLSEKSWPHLVAGG